MHVLPRLRLAFARHPWLHWAIAALAGALIWLQIASADRAATSARDAWGTSTPVWVAAAGAERGQPVRAERLDVPVAVVPDGAVTADPVEAVAARRIRRGAVLVDDDLGDGSVPPEWVVFAVPTDAGPSLVEGDRVTVFAAGLHDCDGITGDTGPDGATIDVAVPAECAEALSTALTAGDLVVARRP